jgi:hypothetical protein
MSATYIGAHDKVLVGHYATSRKVTGSRLDEVIEFLTIYLILRARAGPGFYSTPDIN